MCVCVTDTFNALKSAFGLKRVLENGRWKYNVVGTVCWTFKLVVCVTAVTFRWCIRVFFFPSSNLLEIWTSVYVLWCDEIKLQPKACCVYSVTCCCDACEVIWSFQPLKKLHKWQRIKEKCAWLSAIELRGSQVIAERWFHGNGGTRAAFLPSEIQGSSSVCSCALTWPRRLCNHGWVTDISHIRACLASDYPAGTRPGCEMDGDNGVLVVSCSLLLLLLLLYKGRRSAQGTCSSTAPGLLAHWHTRK